MSEPRTTVYEVEVMFGDCDPAGIVFFPNYSKWMDASSLNYFRQCGLPSLQQLRRTRGIAGMPLLEIQTRFRRPATYGERLQVHTSVIEWRDKVFIHRHVVRRGDELLCEGTEVRAFVVHPPEDSTLIKAIAIPQDIKDLCR